MFDGGFSEREFLSSWRGVFSEKEHHTFTNTTVKLTGSAFQLRSENKNLYTKT